MDYGLHLDAFSSPPEDRHNLDSALVLREGCQEL